MPKEEQWTDQRVKSIRFCNPRYRVVDSKVKMAMVW